jgi:hypothetical protein
MSTAKPILLTELVDGKEPDYGEEEHHVLKADPPEEIAAWDRLSAFDVRPLRSNQEPAINAGYGPITFPDPLNPGNWR